MEGIRNALARMDAIRATIEGPRRQEATSVADGTFATMLTQALAQGSTGGLGTTPSWLTALQSAAGSTTGLASLATTGPSSGAPAGLEHYENGQIPFAALSKVHGTEEYLWAPAARAFEGMRADAAGRGVALPISDGYRQLHEQEHLAEELGLYRDGGLAAVPGTSQHGWGRAVDLELDDRALTWMRANGERYGFAETVPGEPWHWEYAG